jgi:phospholipid transport system substrate-binding protein
MKSKFTLGVGFSEKQIASHSSAMQNRGRVPTQVRAFLIAGTMALTAVISTPLYAKETPKETAEEAKVTASSDPVSLIRTKDVELQKLLREKKTDGHRARLKELINGIFDFAELGKRSLGRKVWDEATEKQREDFVKSFKAMVENSSLKKLDAYRSDSTRYDAAEGDEDKTEVVAHVWNKGTESLVVYKLRADGGSWKAWDLVIDDLSTARNYNEQFRKILEKHGIDELIARLEKKAAEDADPPTKKADNVKAAGATKKL